jgi:hypothetical protein
LLGARPFDLPHRCLAATSLRARPAGWQRAMGRPVRCGDLLVVQGRRDGPKQLAIGAPSDDPRRDRRPATRTGPSRMPAARFAASTSRLRCPISRGSSWAKVARDDRDRLGSLTSMGRWGSQARSIPRPCVAVLPPAPAAGRGHRSQPAKASRHSALRGGAELLQRSIVSVVPVDPGSVVSAAKLVPVVAKGLKRCSTCNRSTDRSGRTSPSGWSRTSATCRGRLFAVGGLTRTSSLPHAV